VASEARRAARALIEQRVERFESRHATDVSKARLEAALARARPTGRVVFTPHWIVEDGRAVLEAGFAPPPRIDTILKATSIAMVLLVAATAWAFVEAGEALAWMLGLSTCFMVLGLPFVFVALGSNREAEESRIRRAIRAALMDEEEKLPPMKKWGDEE
jgi:hypothetical protein